ncbi:Snf7-domain-containing protein [Exidia glandulosa HHB12029]|uniref:Snf7-domain-containing protein n=1 Tax=Exidia glandulosa HHB12029 TaxID=1314781 RepID=A0A165PS45_EXIGL|nr:Snf7-domain-containing protein [Exidia glandulosa HHB12029]
MQRFLTSLGLRQPGPTITQQDRAILDLKHQRDRVKQYQKKIQVVLDREQEIAKQCLRAGQKDRALVALRRRKYQESILAKTDSQLENLEQLVSTIEFSLVQVAVMEGLKQGNDVLKEIHKELNIDNVEKLLDETREAQAYQREVDEALMSQMTADEEEAVQQELEELVRLTQPDVQVPTLPEAPIEEPVAQPGEIEPVEAERQPERTRVALPA